MTGRVPGGGASGARPSVSGPASGDRPARHGPVRRGRRGIGTGLAILLAIAVPAVATTPYDEATDPHAGALRQCFQSQQTDPLGAAATAERILDAQPVRIETQLRALVCLGMAKGTLGEPAAADQAATKVLTLLDLHALPVGEQARARMNAAGILQTIGQPQRATALLERALDAAKADAPGLSQLMMLDSLALLHAADLENNEVAEGYFRQAIELAPMLGAENPMRYYSAALNLVQLGRHDEAMRAFDRAEAMATRPGPGLDQLLYRIRTNRTDVLVARGERDRALAELQTSVLAQQQLRDVQGEAVSRAKLGALQLTAGDTGAALASATAALRLADQGNFINEQRDALKLLVNVHRSRGELAQALGLAQRQHDMELARLRNRNLRTMAALQAQLESQDQVRQVERLQHQNQVQSLRVERAGLLRNAAVALLGLVGVVGTAFVLYQRRVNRRLRRWSTLDPLTGLINRREAARRLAAAERDDRRRMVLFLVDADRFKAINDTYGHAAGDRVLVELSTRLQAACRSGDILARWGGEEFVVACPHETLEQATATAERLRSAAVQRPVRLAGDEAWPLSVSIGFAPLPFFPDASSEQWQKALRIADIALYVAKHSGRDAWAGLWGVDGSGVAPQTIGRDLEALARQGRIRLAGSRPMRWQAAAPEAAADAMGGIGMAALPPS